MGEAIVTTVVQKVVEKREKKNEFSGVKWSRRLSWLNKMLWGGTLMLAIDHIISGEIIARPPFLTALQTPAVMLREMATVGVAMAAAVTAVWGIMVLVAEIRTRVATGAKRTLSA
jgi:hypothetical protein